MCFPDCLAANVSMAEVLYFRVGGTARWYAQPQSIAEAALCVHYANNNKLPLAVVGSGTNLVFSDEEFPGLVLSCAKLLGMYWENEQTLFVGAGVPCTAIAEECLQQGRDNAWWMHKLPGLIGAAIRMNARCFGGEMSAVVSEILSIDAQGTLHLRKGAEALLGYKDTIFMKNPELIAAARLHFPQKKSAQDIKAQMAQCEQDRVAKHHFDFPSCGSTFKNNHDLGISSGKIFDECGLRGTQLGGAQISMHHGNFIFNTGTASAVDILSLAALMKNTAAAKGYAPLHLEMEVVGSFPTPLLKECGISSISSDGKSWAGLFEWGKAIAEPTFSSFFSPYFPRGGAPEISTSIRQLRALDAVTPDDEFIEWCTHVPTHKLRTYFSVPSQEPLGAFVPELWHASVSEIFFSSGEQYSEFELTPDLHWLAIAHVGRRVRKAGHENPEAHFWPGVERFCFADASHTHFGIRFSYKVLQHLIHEKQIDLQCCLSLGNGFYLLAPAWNPPAAEQPDFHQPQRFFRWTLF